MALSCPGLLKSTKFLCKYVQIHPPSAVVCYVHSHLAVQPCKDPLLYFLDCHKSRKYEQKSKQPVSVRNKECNTVSTILCSVARESNYLVQEFSNVSGKAIPGSFHGIESAAAVNTTPFYKETITDTSLLGKWNADPLMDKKQFVLMVFKSDNFTGRPRFEQKSYVKDFYSPKTKPLSKARVSRKTYGQTRSEKGTNPLKEPWEEMKHHKEIESIVLTAAPSSNSCHVNSVSEAVTFHTNLYSDIEKPKTGNVIRSGPDATQLSSVLLALREEIPEFFLKKPNYGMCHKEIKFVNNISRTTTHGIHAYRAQISGARWALLSCMTDLTVEVLKITKHTDEGAIKVRWRIKGLPLIKRLVPFIGNKAKREAETYRYLDGFSVFVVGNDGLIHSHELHKVMPSSSKEKDSPLWMLSYLALLRLLNPRPSESVGAFECWSTIEGLYSMQGSDALPC